MRTIEQLNRRWHDYFTSPGAVPLLGLSPMSNEEAAEAKRAVHEFVRGRADSLPRCLEVHVTIQPGRKTEFEGPGGERFLLASRMVPIVLAETLSFVLTHDGEKILLGDSLRLNIWLPQGSSGWSVKLTGVGDERTFNCDLKDTESGWATAEIDASAFAKQLAPMLHEIEAILLKNGQTKAQRTFLLWIGCHEFHKIGSFAWTRRPTNLNAPECVGFEETTGGLQVKTAIMPFRTLTFKLEGGARQFRWRNPGLFAELVHPQSGQAAVVKQLIPGETVAASADSSAWLRVWFPRGRPEEKVPSSAPA